MQRLGRVDDPRYRVQLKSVAVPPGASRGSRCRIPCGSRVPESGQHVTHVPRKIPPDARLRARKAPDDGSRRVESAADPFGARLELSRRHALRLRVRLTNHGRYAAGFGDSDFRLKIGDDVTAPTSGVGDIVAGESTKENTISFPLPTSAAAATLRVVSAGETAEIPLDLTGREGLTAPQDRDLRRAGKRTAALPLDADKARLRFGDLTCEVRSASAHRYVNKLVLTLSVRAQNNGRYDAGFGDYHFRLLLGGTAQAPVSGLSTVVSPQTSLDGSIVFDLPLDARDVVIRVRYFETTAELPLTIPAAR